MRLRPLEPEDLELLYTIENDPEMWDSSDSDAPFSKFALKQYIATPSSIYESGQLRLVIETECEQGVYIAVGIVELINYSPLHARAEVGIALLKEHRGKHLAAKAMKLIEQLATDRFRIHSLYALVASSNSTCQNLLLSVGYASVARLPEWHFSAHRYEDILVFQKIFS